ncbi:acetylglutamate kinase [Halobacteriales archaeon QS_8_65_32]|nr:MAG: acetylglutamate kinase [Halobacteriales archaeon QS_8_65_32]
MTVVAKIGGARAVDPAGALADVASLVADGERVVVVHGGSTAVDDILEELGETPEYVETPSGVVGRFTDERTIEVFEMVLPGKLNTDLVAGLQAEGVNAVGLSGVDGALFSGPRKSVIRVVESGKKKIRRGDFSGTIEDVNADLLTTLLDGGYTPVVTVPMLADGTTPVNADADRAAAAVAGALDGRLVSLTDVPGVLADPGDGSTLIGQASTESDLADLEDAASGFMTRKVMAAIEALERGGEEVVVADANADNPITAALDGTGTRVTPGAIGRDETNGADETDEADETGENGTGRTDETAETMENETNETNESDEAIES